MTTESTALLLAALGVGGWLLWYQQRHGNWPWSTLGKRLALPRPKPQVRSYETGKADYDVMPYMVDTYNLKPNSDGSKEPISIIQP